MSKKKQKISKKGDLTLVFGDRNSGKTHTNKEYIKEYIKRYPKERVLVIDANNEYDEYNNVSLGSINKIKKPSRICLQKLTKKEMDSFFSDISLFKGGLIVFEDIKTIKFFCKPSFDFEMFLFQRECDVIITFNTFSDSNIKFDTRADYLRIHKSTFFDSGKHPDYAESIWGQNFSIAYNFVNIKSKLTIGKHHVLYDTRNENILNFDDEDALYYKEAVIAYFNPEIEKTIKSLKYGKNKR